MFQRALFFTGVMVLALIGVALFSSRPASAAVSSWQKGASVVPTSSTDYASENTRQSLRNLKASNADYVSFVVPYYQSNIYSTDIQAGWNTPTDQSLYSAIYYAHSIGLKVAIKPHLDSYDGQWRANINPGDRNGWFYSYGEMLKHYAFIANETSTEEIIIGTELIAMTVPTSHPDNTWRWESLIATVREMFHGKLTYSAQGGQPEEKSLIQFWPSLDYIGLSAYFDLNPNYYTSVDALKADWEKINNEQIKPLQQRWNKPVIFTEVGYRSYTGSHTNPWDYSRGGNPDQAAQAMAYEALFSYWNNQPSMAGIFWWDWSTNPWATEQTSYSPQNKVAALTMKNWFAGSTPSVPQPDPGNPTLPSVGDAVEIWWPSNGSSVSGTQPFTAKLKGTANSAYQLYWQVDGGQLNAMYNSSQDGEHKEALVDLSGWSWNPQGTYKVNFVAKDAQGNVLAESVTTIMVTR